jgi:hypothetical protein
MVSKKELPRWLKPANRLVMALQRLGLPLGTIHVLSVPGRRSGKMRTTPVSLMTVDGTRYIIGGMAEADWVKNAQAARWGVLAYGRKKERVALVELPLEERPVILREFPRLVPHGVPYFQRVYGLPKDPAMLPDAFARLAPNSAVFRVETPAASKQHDRAA